MNRRAGSVGNITLRESGIHKDVRVLSMLNIILKLLIIPE